MPLKVKQNKSLCYVLRDASATESKVHILLVPSGILPWIGLKDTVSVELCCVFMTGDILLSRRELLWFEEEEIESPGVKAGGVSCCWYKGAAEGAAHAAPAGGRQRMSPTMCASCATQQCRTWALPCSWEVLAHDHKHLLPECLSFQTSVFSCRLCQVWMLLKSYKCKFNHVNANPPS